MNKVNIIPEPSKAQHLTLRLLIVFAILNTAFFWIILLNPNNVGHPVLYWIIIGTMGFNSLSLLHEWYHYFSISTPKIPQSSRPYTVDIFTTFCKGETHEMIVQTLEAIQKITYPHQTYLCDEENDPFLVEECKRLGVHHVTRKIKINAKAGNINNALAQSSGELCVVLDPDHVPAPNFLDPIVPHFEDPEVGFVQVVQAYGNLDENLIAKGAAQQTFQFYGPMMMTMNSYGTVMAIGANCTFRRTALDSIGGHAAGLAEDMHTAMQLHAKGWKSKYVPVVLTKGLVPSSLSAYYKQQLKWSRGVFELLVTTYPALFRKFTWQQKLHYGSIPLFYLSGIVYFLNFLVPILCLFFAIIPLKIDLLQFAIVALPLLASTLLIRHYAQRWVMEEKERGFHVVGGLLLIGTWWIYMLGFFFTLIRRKVPYDPTPKDGSDPNNWSLNIPNMVIGLTSIAAIIYGLYTDYNPYSLAMASLALVNSLFMVFVIIASRQPNIRLWKKRYYAVIQTFSIIRQLKIVLWNIRHGIYFFFRKLALPVVIFFTISAYFISQNPPDFTTATDDVFLPVKKDFFMQGLFDPETSDGLSSMGHVQLFEKNADAHMDIVSLYMAWNEVDTLPLPTKLLDSIYRHNSYAMVTWEPWGTMVKNEKQVLSQIRQGVYDSYIASIASALRDLQQPIFLRFAHEPDNPSYPWSKSGGNTPADYRASWQYVRNIFHKHGAFNVIWVWNPWKAHNADAYFPGIGQVDWLALTILDYSVHNPDGKSYSFAELCRPFLKTKSFQSGLPIMIAEAGTLSENKKEWFWHANAYLKQKNKIKAVVYFNYALDQNVPKGSKATALDWRMKNLSDIGSPIKTQVTTSGRAWLASRPLSTSQAISHQKALPFESGVGINYIKGQSWLRNFHTLTKREVLSDFEKIKALGISCVKIYGPGLYDRNMLRSAKKKNLKLVYGFYIPQGVSFEDSLAQVSDYQASILETVEELKNDTSIVAWSIEAKAFEEADRRFFKPMSLYPKYAYVAWLKKLITAIANIDATRPITVSLAAHEKIAEDLAFLHQQLPMVSSFGLEVTSDVAGIASLRKSQIPFYFSKMEAKHLKNWDRLRPVFLSDWQDTWSSNGVTFHGLIDHWGRKKKDYFATIEALSTYTKKSKANLPSIKILKSSDATYPGAILKYHAILKIKNDWRLAYQLGKPNYRFNWYLVRTDELGRPKELKEVAKGASVNVRIPNKPHLYKLYVNMYLAKESNGTLIQLNNWSQITANAKD